MNRNINSRFSMLPTVDIERSRFSRPFQHKTTFNAGELIPIFFDEVLPGDTFSLDMSSLVRMSTPIFPTMDNAYLDTYFFFVPNRLVWNHWKEFNGENTSGYWTQPTEYTIPQLKATHYSFVKGSLGDYFGLPTYTKGISISSLPFRAYTLIWNEFFRDQNTMAPAYFRKDDSDIETQNSSNNPGDFDDRLLYALYGGKPLPVAKYHDYFTSVLPQPQKGSPVEISLLSSMAPVVTGEPHLDNANGVGVNYPSMKYVAISPYSGVPDNTFLGVSSFSDGTPSHFGSVTVGNDGFEPGAISGSVAPSNLYANLENVAVATISQLRQAFQLQKLFEKDARGGKNSLCLHVKKIAEKIWKAFFYWLIRGEGVSQPQRIGNVIIFPRGRDTFLVKRYAKLY